MHHAQSNQMTRQENKSFKTCCYPSELIQTQQYRAPLLCPMNSLKTSLNEIRLLVSRIEEINETRGPVYRQTITSLKDAIDQPNLPNFSHRAIIGKPSFRYLSPLSSSLSKYMSLKRPLIGLVMLISAKPSDWPAPLASDSLKSIRRRDGALHISSSSNSSSHLP